MKIKRTPVLILIVAVTGFVVLNQKKHLLPARASTPYVFVNETNDHRFDESIQVSIMSSFKRTRVQNAVVITDRFPPEDLEKSAAEIFKTLALGSQSNGRAILYLFSPKTKSLKIEVGYTLEGVMPDVEVHGLEAAAKSFIFADRYQDFWAELINTINIEIYEKEHGTKDVTSGFDFSKMKFASGGAGISSFTYSASPEQFEAEMKMLSKNEQAKFQPSSDIHKSLETYLESLRLGIGDENLPILSTESYFFRLFTPLTNYQQYRNWKMYTHAGVHRLLRSGHFYFVFFQPGYPVLPLIFKIEDGVWKVQEPLSWSLFQRFEDSMQVFLKFPMHLKSLELQHYLTQAFRKPLYRAPTVDPEKFAQLSADVDPVSFFYFKYYWLERVANELDKSASMKRNHDFLWIALDTNTNLGRFSRFLKTMSQIASLNPSDEELQRDFKFYKDALKFSGNEWTLHLPGP